VFTRGSLFTPAPIYDKVFSVCFKPSKRKKGRCGVKCAKNKWEKASWLAAAGCLLVLVANHASAQEAGRYQWTMAPRDGGEGSPIVPYIFDSVTGEIAKWNPLSNKWVPDMKTTPVDWEDIRMQRENRENAAKARIEVAEKKRAENQAKRDAFLETVPRKSLEELLAGLEDLVEKAESIQVMRYMGRQFIPRLSPDGTPLQETLQMENYAPIETLKGGRMPAGVGRPWIPPSGTPSQPLIERFNDWKNPSLEKKEGDIFVLFTRKLEEDVYVQFCLSSTVFDNKTIFSAPSTIVENIKAILEKQGLLKRKTVPRLLGGEDLNAVLEIEE
jgi:hypothetical protein